MNALLVEDDDAIVEYIDFCLKKLGYTVTIARDGMAALDCCRDQVFDWAICDIRMPRLSGISFISNVRRIAPGAVSRIIVMSSMDDRAVKAEALGVGAEVFLVKPVTMQVLREILGSPDPAAT